MLLGAVDVVSGEFKAFDSRQGEITADAVLASAAIPTLFRSVHEAGGVYWDGLFSQNPPVRDLLATEPDEIWVIQINAKERDGRAAHDPGNRRPAQRVVRQPLAVSGTAFHREDRLDDRGGPPGRRRVQADHHSDHRDGPLGQVTEARRRVQAEPRPAFLDELIDQGEDRAEEFVAALGFEQAWRAGDADRVIALFRRRLRGQFASRRSPCGRRSTGTAGVREFVDRALGRKIRLDLTRKQISGDRVSWRIRLPAGENGTAKRGLAQARFASGKIASFRLGPLR